MLQASFVVDVCIYKCIHIMIMYEFTSHCTLYENIIVTLKLITKILGDITIYSFLMLFIFVIQSNLTTCYIFYNLPTIMNGLVMNNNEDLNFIR